MYIWVVFVELTSGIRTNDKVTSHDREHRWRVGGLGLTWSVSLGQNCFGFNETKSFWCFFLFSVLDQVLWKLILVQQTGLHWTDCQLNILLIIIHDRGQSLNLNIVFTKWQLFCVSQLTLYYCRQPGSCTGTKTKPTHRCGCDRTDWLQSDHTRSQPEKPLRPISLQMEDDVEVELELEKQLALAHELFPTWPKVV